MYGEFSRGISRLANRFELFTKCPLHAITPQGQYFSIMWTVDSTIIMAMVVLLWYLFKVGYVKVNRIPGVHKTSSILSPLLLLGFLVLVADSHGLLYSNDTSTITTHESLSNLYTININDVAIRNAHLKVKFGLSRSPITMFEYLAFPLFVMSIVLYRCSKLEKPQKFYPFNAMMTTCLLMLSPISGIVGEIVRWLSIVSLIKFCYWSTANNTTNRVWYGPRQNPPTNTSINPWTGEASGLNNRISEWYSSAFLMTFIIINLTQLIGSDHAFSQQQQQQQSLYSVPVGIANQFGRDYSLQSVVETSYCNTVWLIVYMCCLFKFSFWTIKYGVHICANRLISECPQDKANTEAVVVIPNPHTGERVGLRFVRPLFRKKSSGDQICMLSSKPGGGRISHCRERIVTHIEGAAVDEPQQAATFVKTLISKHYDDEDSNDSSDESDSGSASAPPKPELQLKFTLAEVSYLTLYFLSFFFFVFFQLSKGVGFNDEVLPSFPFGAAPPSKNKRNTK